MLWKVSDQDNAVYLLGSFHLLKEDDYPLSEDIEMFGRHCVEAQISPEEYLPRVVTLRPLFEETLEALEREANPLVQRRPSTFGRAASA